MGSRYVTCFINYVVCALVSNIGTPLSYKDALTGANSTLWMKVIDDELHSPYLQGTWTPMDRTKLIIPNLLTTKWIFKLKDDECNITKYKTRLAAKGYKQA